VHIEQPRREWKRGPAGAAPHPVGRLEAGGHDVAVGLLDPAVGQFDSGHEELEPLGDRWGSVAHAAQCRLRGRPLFQKRGPPVTKPRLHHLGQQQFEAPIPTFVGIRRTGRPRDAEPIECRLERRRIGRERIDAGVVEKRLAAGDPLDAPRAQHRRADLREQVDRGLEAFPRRVPLEQHELDVVLPPTLTLPEGAGELVDRARSRSQEPLHQQFRARLKIAHRVADGHADRVDVGLGHHLRRQDGRVDLDEATGVEQRRDGPPHAGPPFEQRTDAHRRGTAALMLRPVS
jgi:hypothetical protein